MANEILSKKELTKRLQIAEARIENIIFAVNAIYKTLPDEDRTEIAKYLAGKEAEDDRK